MLHGLSQMHEVALDGAWVRLPGHEVRLTPADERLWSKVSPLIGKDERFRPPRVRDIAAVLGVGEADVLDDERLAVPRDPFARLAGLERRDPELARDGSRAEDGAVLR